MDFIYIGDLVNTHGIKGEVRILCDFKYKANVFMPGFSLYIGKNKEKLVIKTYRTHKIYDMVTFEGIDDINDVLMYKGELVYINRNDLNVDGYLEQDLVGMTVQDGEKLVGTVKYLMNSKKYSILVIEYNNKEYLVPNIDEFIKNVDLDKRQITINNIKGLIDEN